MKTKQIALMNVYGTPTNFKTERMLTYEVSQQ